MKQITEFLSQKGFLFTQFKAILPSALGSKKKIKIYSGISLDDKYISVFIVDQKSRFIQKDTIVLEELLAKLKILEDHNFRQNILIMNGDICSKSIKILQENNWTIFYDFM